MLISSTHSRFGRSIYVSYRQKLNNLSCILCTSQSQSHNSQWFARCRKSEVHRAPKWVSKYHIPYEYSDNSYSIVQSPSARQQFRIRNRFVISIQIQIVFLLPKSVAPEFPVYFETCVSDVLLVTSFPWAPLCALDCITNISGQLTLSL